MNYMFSGATAFDQPIGGWDRIIRHDHDSGLLQGSILQQGHQPVGHLKVTFMNYM